MNVKQLRAKEWRGHCTMCGQTFSFADGFECELQPGRHTVDVKTYYHLGGATIQAMKERRQFQVLLNLQPDIEVRDKVTGQITRLEGLMVQTHPGGVYETTDPLEQYHLDMHPAVFSGEEGYEAWKKVYYTQEQQLHEAQAKLAGIQKEIREKTALLDLTKRQKQEEYGMDVR